MMSARGGNRICRDWMSLLPPPIHQRLCLSRATASCHVPLFLWLVVVSASWHTAASYHFFPSPPVVAPPLVMPPLPAQSRLRFIFSDANALCCATLGLVVGCCLPVHRCLLLCHHLLSLGCHCRGPLFPLPSPLPLLYLSFPLFLCLCG